MLGESSALSVFMRVTPKEDERYLHHEISIYSHFEIEIFAILSINRYFCSEKHKICDSAIIHSNFMKRIILTLSLLLTAVAYSTAHERTMSEMLAIAANQLNSAANAKARQGGVQAQDFRCISETPAYAVFEPEGSDAYVIVSKSDLTKAVIGYAEHPFKANQMPPALSWYLKSVEQTILKAEAQGKTLASTQAAYHTVEPFITTMWHQSSPFSDLTPNNYAAGCVAIAMAQCINYRQYPATVKFRGYCSYLPNSSSTRYVIDSLDISSLYMYPFLDSYGRATDKQKKRVATLARDCGYAALMQYTPSGSGAYSLNAAVALQEYFHYPEACVKYMHRVFTTDDEWYRIIYSELMNESPVIMGANDEQAGGHAFILCGIDDDGLVYVNWGWGADGDGYYAIDLMDVEDFSFKYNQEIVYGIRTTPLATDIRRPRWSTLHGEFYTFQLAIEEDSNHKPFRALHIVFKDGLENYTPTSLEGECGLFGQDLTTGEAWQITETDPVNWPAGSYIDLTEPKALYYYNLEEDLIPGHTYRMSFGTRDKIEGTWHSVLCQGGEIAYDLYYTGDINTSTISEVQYITPIDAIAAPTANTLANDGLTRVYDLQGRLLYTAPTASFNLWEVPARGILVIKEGDKARKVAR